jgi:hypothetical protein
MPRIPLNCYPAFSSCRDKGCERLPFLLSKNHLAIIFKPRVGGEDAVVTRDPDLKGGGHAAPPEEPGEDESFFEARGCDRGEAARNFHKPSQAGDRRHRL